MGIDFGVIWAADFDFAIRFYVRRPASRPRITRHPPTHQNSRKMTNISLWVSILGLFGLLNSIILLDFTSVAPSAGQRSPATRRYTKTKEDDRYIVMGIVFGVIWIADFNNAIRFYVHRPARRPRVTRWPMVTRRPPPHQNSKKMTNISLWVSILGLFGPLISMMT